MVVFAPVLLAWAEGVPSLRAHGKARWLELAVVSAALLVFCLVAFGPARTGRFVPGPYSTLPIVFWAAIRFGPAGAATAVLVVAAFAIWYAALAVGPFSGAGLSEDMTAFHVYAFVAACGVSSLFTAAALEERRIAVRDLWHSEERYRTMLETANDAILTIDAGQRIQFANAAVRTIFGYPPPELVGRDVGIVVPDWQGLTSALEAARSAGALATASKAFPVVGRHKDGRDVAVEISFGEYPGTAAPAFTATMAHIFEPFFTTKPLGQGTGLGLATVHGAVKQNHGAIEVRSELGRGTSFVVYLPRVDAPVQESEAPPRRLAGRTGTVLVVEDEDAVRNLTQRVLEKARYAVLLAASPTAALNLARATGRIDLLLSDIVLPEMSGTALAAKVCEYHPGIKVLFMSGYTDDMIVRHGLTDRTIAMVEKPFTPETLLRRVQEISDPSS